MTIHLSSLPPGATTWASRSIALLALALAGCGGGGDDSPPPPAVNAAPRALPALVADGGLPSLGADVLLSGAGSTDPEGAALSYSWTLASRPTDSKATLASSTSVGTQFTPDVMGSYVVRLRATDPAGASSEQELKVEVANRVPTPVLDKSAMTVLSGGNVNLSAALSYDGDGDPLTYAWSLDSRPPDSSAVLANPNAAALSFSPDRPGNYVLLVKVNDGKRAASSRVTVTVRAQMAGSVGISWTPLDARYSRALDRLVAVSAGPDALHIVDPFSGLTKSVILPAPYKSMALSANGRTAAVLHEGLLSIIDLESARLLNSWPTGGSQTEVALSDAGMAYLSGQTGGQWVWDGVTTINTRDGTRATSGNIGTGQMYGTVRGVYSQKLAKGFLVTEGLSPIDITWYSADPATALVTQIGDSPYHGDYPMGGRLFLSAAEDLVFTGAGTYFATNTLKYAGRLALNAQPGGQPGQPGPQLSSLSQSPNGETLALAAVPGWYPDYASTYPAAYQRFTGPLMLAAGELAFPKIGEQPSYGIKIFHSAADHHVALVQTGSDRSGAAQAKYYLIYR